MLMLHNMLCYTFMWYVAYLAEKKRHTEVEEVVSKIGLVHPITHDGYDICERAKLDALSNLTVPKLEPSE